MKLWEVVQKLGKVSWICVYAACKGSFGEVQSYPELLQRDDTALNKTHVYEFSDQLQFFFKTYFCSLWNSRSPKTRQATHSPERHCQKSMDLTTAYQINKFV